jgi:hypothetical protein
MMVSCTCLLQDLSFRHIIYIYMYSSIYLFIHFNTIWIQYVDTSMCHRWASSFQYHLVIFGGKWPWFPHIATDVTAEAMPDNNGVVRSRWKMSVLVHCSQLTYDDVQLEPFSGKLLGITWYYQLRNVVNLGLGDPPLVIYAVVWGLPNYELVMC